MRLALADIKMAYLQSGPIKRDIYVRAPPEYHNLFGYVRSILWSLVKIPFIVVEPGLQWKKRVETWMLEEGRLQRGFVLSKLYLRRDRHGRIPLIAAKVMNL